MITREVIKVSRVIKVQSFAELGVCGCGGWGVGEVECFASMQKEKGMRRNVIFIIQKGNFLKERCILDLKIHEDLIFHQITFLNSCIHRLPLKFDTKKEKCEGKKFESRNIDFLST